MRSVVILLSLLCCNEFVRSTNSHILLGPICGQDSSRPCLRTPRISTKAPKSKKNLSEINTWRPNEIEGHKNSEERTLGSSNFNKQLLRPRGADGHSLHANDFPSLERWEEAEKNIHIGFRRLERIEGEIATAFLFASIRKDEQKPILEYAYKKDISVGTNEPDRRIGYISDATMSAVFKGSNGSFIPREFLEKSNIMELRRSYEKYFPSGTPSPQFEADGTEKEKTFAIIEPVPRNHNLIKISETNNGRDVNDSSISNMIADSSLTVNENENYISNTKKLAIVNLTIEDSKSKVIIPFQSLVRQRRNMRSLAPKTDINLTPCTKACKAANKTFIAPVNYLMHKFRLENKIHTSEKKNNFINKETFHAFENVNSRNNTVPHSDRKEHHRSNQILKPNKPFTYAEDSLQETKFYPIEGTPQFKKNLKSRSISDNNETVADETYQTGIAEDEVTYSLLLRMLLRSTDEDGRKKSELQIYEKSLDKHSGALKMETGSGDQLKGDIRGERQNEEQYIYSRLKDLGGASRSLGGSDNHSGSPQDGKSIQGSGRKFRQSSIEQSRMQPIKLNFTRGINYTEVTERLASGVILNIFNSSVKLNNFSVETVTALPAKSKDVNETLQKETYKNKSDNIRNQITKTLNVDSFKNNILQDRPTTEATIDSINYLNSGVKRIRNKRQLIKLLMSNNHKRRDDSEFFDTNHGFDDDFLVVVDRSTVPVVVRVYKRDNPQISRKNMDSKPESSGVSRKKLIRNLGSTPHAFVNARQSAENGFRWKKIRIMAIEEGNRKFDHSSNNLKNSEYTEADSYLRPKSRLKSWFETRLRGNLRNSKNLSDFNGKGPPEIWYIVVPDENSQESSNPHKEASTKGSKREVLQKKIDDDEKPIARQRELESEDSDDINGEVPYRTTYRSFYIYPKNKPIHTLSRGVKRNKPNLKQYERYIEEGLPDNVNDTEIRGFIEWFNRQWGFINSTESIFIEEFPNNESQTDTSINQLTTEFPNTHRTIGERHQNTTEHPDDHDTTRQINILPDVEERDQRKTNERESKKPRIQSTNTVSTIKPIAANTTNKPENIVNEPVTGQPVTQRPVTRQPVTQKPVTRKPVTRRPVTQKPFTRKPVTRKPVTRKPVTRKPVTPEPVTDKPITPEPVTDKPITYDPWWTNKPVTYDPWWNEKPVTHDPWWNQRPVPNYPWGIKRPVPNDPWGNIRPVPNDPWGNIRPVPNNPWWNKKPPPNNPWGNQRPVPNYPWGNKRPVPNDPWWNKKPPPNDPWRNKKQLPNDPWWNKKPLPNDPWWNEKPVTNDPWWNEPTKKPWKRPIPCKNDFVPNNPWNIWWRTTTPSKEGWD